MMDNDNDGGKDTQAGSAAIAVVLGFAAGGFALAEVQASKERFLTRGGLSTTISMSAAHIQLRKRCPRIPKRGSTWAALAFHTGGEPSRFKDLSDLAGLYGVALWMTEQWGNGCANAWNWAGQGHDLIARWGVNAIDHMWGFFGDGVDHGNPVQVKFHDGSYSGHRGTDIFTPLRDNLVNVIMRTMRGLGASHFGWRAKYAPDPAVRPVAFDVLGLGERARPMTQKLHMAADAKRTK